MPVPREAQLIIIFDGISLRAEAPGPNGSRQKIELPTNPHDFMAIIKAELTLQFDRNKRLAAEARPAPSVADRVDPQILREKRIAEARAAHDREWNEKLNSMTEAERERAIALRDAKLEKARQAQISRAHSVWERTATDHSIDLANRVIADPSRRPRNRIKLSDNSYLLPRGKAAKRRPMAKLGEVVSINLEDLK